MTLNILLLLSVPALPLLLAVPALRSRLYRPCHFALLPAVLLLTAPAAFSIEMPWLLFGTGLGIDGPTRLLLVMSVILWASAASLLQAPTDQAMDCRSKTLLLLTMAGNLGVILATDLVGFFAFSALMGYGFYGLLVDGGDETARRAGRAYLCFLILADLALFDALLIAAATTGDMGFEAVRQAIGQSPSSGFYLSMVLAGFALKAGIWPLHFWLPLAFRSARPAVALLLGGVPVTIALLGMVRWLPLGEITSSKPGFIIQGVGVAAILYAILAVLIRTQLKLLPAYAVIIATGLFVTALGTGLADPAAWARYENWVHFYIVSLGFGSAVLTIAIGWLHAKREHPATPEISADGSLPWFERWPGAVMRWVGQTGFDTLPRLRASWLATLGRLWLVICAWQSVLDASERTLQRWTFVITLFLLLGIAVAFVGVSSWLV